MSSKKEKWTPRKLAALSDHIAEPHSDPRLALLANLIADSARHIDRLSRRVATSEDEISTLLNEKSNE